MNAVYLDVFEVSFNKPKILLNSSFEGSSYSNFSNWTFNNSTDSGEVSNIYTLWEDEAHNTFYSIGLIYEAIQTTVGLVVFGEGECTLKWCLLKSTDVHIC